MIMTVLFKLLCITAILFPEFMSEGPLRYRILSLYNNMQTITVDTEVKKINDVISERPEIVWGENKAMRVRDIKTGKIYLVTPKTLNVLTGHKWESYGPVFEKTSVNTDGDVVAEEREWYYLVSEKAGNGTMGRLTADMSIAEWPESISLYLHPEEGGADRLIVSDFRDFLHHLRRTDTEVKEILGGLEYFKGEEYIMRYDYMIMMYNYIADLYKDVRYTYQDLKLFLSIK